MKIREYIESEKRKIDIRKEAESILDDIFSHLLEVENKDYWYKGFRFMDRQIEAAISVEEFEIWSKVYAILLDRFKEKFKNQKICEIKQ